MNEQKTSEDGGLPSGFVTFVFTDIEASTRLVKMLDATDATRAFDLHNSVLRDVWATHRGVEVNTEGDAFFMAFDDAERAVAACVEAQQRLSAETWPGDMPVRVRIGIHAGLASPHLDNYVSLAVHQASRVEAAAHGGQILATSDVLAEVSLPVGSRVEPIGVYSLRDFDEPVPLFRIDPAGLTPVTTAIRATPAVRHNLIAVNTSFVGRESDLALVNSLLKPAFVLSLVGPGGVGKTRLATEVGIRIADSYDDGVWMVELAEVHDDELFVEALAQAIGASQAAKGSRWADILDHLTDANALLMLDNLEQIVDIAAPRLADLVARCPSITVLTTTRQPLDLRIEQVYRVQPLTSQPDADADSDAESAAVQLFFDRAIAADSAFQTRSDDRSKIAAVCDRVDGLPLAIEIAAARVRTMSIDDLHESLTDQLAILRSRDRSLPDRHRTMQALLSWSYDLLDEKEQHGLCRLAVFATDFSGDAARAVLATDASESDHAISHDVIDVLWSLVDKSLVIIDLSESKTRYRLPESVQQFAIEHLNDNNELANAVSAASRWHLGELGPEHPNDRVWLTGMAIELTNLRGLVDLLTGIDQHAAQLLMCSIGRYHDQVGSYSTGVDELERVVAELTESTPARVALLATLADLHLRRGDVEQATTHLDEAEALQLRTSAPPWDDTAIARSRGEIALRQGHGDRAVHIANQALAASTTELGAARMWNLKGLALSWTGDSEAATQAFEAELTLWRDMGLDAKIATTHGNLAEIAWRRRDLRAAAAHQRACLELSMVHGVRVQTAYSFLMAARFCEIEEQWADAVRLNHSAMQIVDEAGAELYAEDREAVDRARDRASAALGASHIDALVSPENSESILDTAALAVAVFTRIKEAADISG